MSKILIVNSGSTSLKYKVYENGLAIASGKIESVTDHREAVKQALKEIADLRDISFIGHRIVHGGGVFYDTIEINKENLAVIESFNHLAPLHNPYAVMCIKEMLEYLPGVRQFAVFDTSFFHNLPDQTKYYPLPTEITESMDIRRFGFHGISHNYIMLEAANELGKNPSEINIITCHLGGGCSVAAIKHGRPIDISMGYTPLEGLMMTTRTGDIDAGLVIELIKKLPGEINENKVQMVSDLINKKSGYFGLTDGIVDFRDLMREYNGANPKVTLAVKMFIYRIVKYIGAYVAALDGQVDAIVFSGGIGAGNPFVKDMIARSVSFTKAKLLMIKTDEELMIVREIEKIIK